MKVCPFLFLAEKEGFDAAVAIASPLARRRCRFSAAACQTPTGCPP